VFTGGAGARALERAFEDIFGMPHGLADLPLAGRTDPWIVEQMAASRGVRCDDPAMQRFNDAYLVHLAREIQQPGPRKGVLPGVRPLLDSLAARSDAYVGLLTGNIEGGARIKLEYFDLWRYFRFGAFGGDAADRNALLGTALTRARAAGSPVFAPADVVIVGDTPLDVAVARAGGARGVAVATASYDREALRESGADVVLDDLGDLGAALTAFQL
jgi:phosphoglycolate phosphatase-like HAD superfamily hydrolase